MNEELEHWPEGLETRIQEEGRGFTASQQLRILLARAIVTNPSLLILDGAIHEVPQNIREPLLNRICSGDFPWTLVIVTTDPHVRDFTEKSLSLFEFETEIGKNTR